MNERLEILREELCDLHIENKELKSEVRFLEQELSEVNEALDIAEDELSEANKLLDGIEEILLNELDAETAHRIYNKIFHIE